MGDLSLELGAFAPRISQEALETGFRALLANATIETAGWGLIQDDEIVWLFEADDREASAGGVKPRSVQAVAACKQLFGCRPNLQWHTHHSMDAYWSVTDLNDQFDSTTRWAKHSLTGEYYFMVINDHLSWKVRHLMWNDLRFFSREGWASYNGLSFSLDAQRAVARKKYQETRIAQAKEAIAKHAAIPSKADNDDAIYWPAYGYNPMVGAAYSAYEDDEFMDGDVWYVEHESQLPLLPANGGVRDEIARIDTGHLDAQIEERLKTMAKPIKDRLASTQWQQLYKLANFLGYESTNELIVDIIANYGEDNVPMILDNEGDWASLGGM